MYLDYGYSYLNDELIINEWMNACVHDRCTCVYAYMLHSLLLTLLLSRCSNNRVSAARGRLASFTAGPTDRFRPVALDLSLATEITREGDPLALRGSQRGVVGPGRAVV